MIFSCHILTASSYFRASNKSKTEISSKNQNKKMRLKTFRSSEIGKKIKMDFFPSMWERCAQRKLEKIWEMSVSLRAYSRSTYKEAEETFYASSSSSSYFVKSKRLSQMQIFFFWISTNLFERVLQWKNTIKFLHSIAIGLPKRLWNVFKYFFSI